MNKILVVEDERPISDLIRMNLEDAGYACTCVYDGMAAADVLEQHTFDLVLLDIMLPKADGYELLEYIKPTGTPVIFLTAKDEENDVVQGFELGADDYIPKPFRNRELISRIQNVLRRTGKTSGILHCQFLKLDTRTGLAYSHGEEVALTKLEYRILSSMMSHPGKLYTREEILAGIWDHAGNFVNDNTLTVTMKRLRDKIGDKDGKIIKTVRGMGYRIEKE